MKRILVTTGLILGLMGAAPATAALPDAVRTDAGLVSGAPASQSSPITAFKGVPFAAPPLGDLRWRPPAPLKPWTGVRETKAYAPVCLNGGRPRPGLTYAEDCLYLNIWTGAQSATDKRAVMVWFHGAGDTAADPVFDGEALAKKGVIVVTVEYRVGALGGLATRELSVESGHNASSNYGLMDATAALNWVQKNIAAFGGDPKNVTLFGQSHGAGTQHFLAMSPMTKGLFHRVILQSHARYPQDPVLHEVATDYTLLKEAEESGATYMQKLGVKSLAELRALPAERIMGTPYGSDHVIDGWFLPANYAQTYAKGAQANAFVIAGFNKDETGASPETNWERVAARNAERAKQPPPPPGSVPQPPIGLAGYIEKSKARYGALADEYLRLYPASSDHEAFTANNEATRDNGRVSLWMWAGAWRAKATQPVYLYYWTHAAPGPGHDFAGAYHGSEISYAYGHQRAGEPWTDEDRKIGDAMSSYWANYARTGNPNGPGLAPWPAWDGKTEQVMELGDRFQAIPLADPAKVSFWKRFYATQPAG